MTPGKKMYPVFMQMAYPLGFCLIAGLWGVGGSRAMANDCSGDQGEPCFANNPDILAGDRALLPVDDLHATVRNANDSANSNRWSIYTENAMVSSSSDNSNTINCDPKAQSLEQSLVGRFFATPNDFVANLRLDSDCVNLKVHALDELNSDNNFDFVALNLTNNTEPTYAGLALGDFNLDGYDDIMYIDDKFARAYTAKCTGDPFDSCTETIADGMSAGPEYGLSVIGPYGGGAISADFNGDGYVDVAWPARDSSKLYVEIVSVCPQAGASVNGKSCSNALEIVPLLRMDLSTDVNLTSKQLPRPTMDIARGNFDGAIDTDTGRADDELILALTNSDNNGVTITVYDYNVATNSMDSKDNTTFDINKNDDNATQVFVEGAQIDPSTQQYQAVFAATENADSKPHKGFMSVLTFDNDLNMSEHTQALTNNSKTRIYGLAVGRFDPPNDSVTGDVDYSKQIGLLIDHDNSDTQIQIWSVNTNTFVPSQSDLYDISNSQNYEEEHMNLAALTKGDLQGRSLLLGEPDVHTVTTTQADVILGLPPMHVDYVPSIDPSDTDPVILNLTVHPPTFNVAFDFDVQASNQLSSQATTSYSGAFKEQVSAKFKYGTSGNNVTTKIKVSAQEQYQRNVTRNYSGYAGKEYSLDVATSFDDVVISTQKRTTVYSYPVIGQFVCPSESPGCPSDCGSGPSPCPPQPLMLQYSGPDNIVHYDPTVASGLEWYQPITEPGNVFTYPPNTAMLEFYLPQVLDIDSDSDVTAVTYLTETNSVWDSTTTQVEDITWTAGGGDSKTVDTTTNFSFYVGGSVAIKESVPETESTKIKLSADTEQSFSWEDARTSSQSFASSSGVTLSRGVGDAGLTSEEYQYNGSTFIFAYEDSPSAIAPDATGEEGSITSHGPLTVGHVADVLGGDGGSTGEWWRQTYADKPDVAVNHPQRWHQKAQDVNDPQQIQFLCPVGYASSLTGPSADPGSCTTTGVAPTPKNVTDTSFYQIKGLFITSGTSQEETAGPTLTSISLGDTVKLQARVYNLSLRNMDANSETVVRFYAQRWDSTNAQFLAGSGSNGFEPAVFIGEDTLIDPIPGYCEGSTSSSDSCITTENPNWALASVVWDTSKLTPQPEDNTDWKIWVVVFAQDASSGDQVAETAHHGLKSIPLQSVDSFADIDYQVYSNNLGYYNQTFSIFLPASNPAAREAEDAGTISIEAIETDDDGLMLDQQSLIRIRHTVAGEDYNATTVMLYEGDPDNGGTLLDVDSIPRMYADRDTVVGFLHIPASCGPQEFFARTYHENGGGPITASATLNIRCATSNIEDLKGTAFTGPPGASQGNGDLRDKGHLYLAGSFTTETAIKLADPQGLVRLTRLLGEDSGNGELVRDLPLLLQASGNRSERNGIYSTAKGELPRAKMHIKAGQTAGAYTFKLTLQQARIDNPGNCPDTSLTTAFELGDDMGFFVSAEQNATWHCKSEGKSLTTGARN